jgi:hypothetical protein
MKAPVRPKGVLLDPPTLRQPGLNEDAQTV